MGNISLGGGTDHPCRLLDLLTGGARRRRRRPIRLIFCQGTTRTLPWSGKKKWVAGEIMFEFPECMVCPADSFFIGHKVPSLGVHDRLLAGQTYFVIPMDRLAACTVLSAATLSSLSPQPGTPIKFAGNNRRSSPFEYLKEQDCGSGTNGSSSRVMIKVTPEFLAQIIMGGSQEEAEMIIKGNGKCNNMDINYYNITNKAASTPPRICSTPELQKRYDEVVLKSKEHVWSPKLEPISECKVRFSPSRFLALGLDRKNVQ